MHHIVVLNHEINAPKNEKIFPNLHFISYALKGIILKKKLWLYRTAKHQIINFQKLFFIYEYVYNITVQLWKIV